MGYVQKPQKMDLMMWLFSVLGLIKGRWCHLGRWSVGICWSSSPLFVAVHEIIFCRSVVQCMKMSHHVILCYCTLTPLQLCPDNPSRSTNRLSWYSNSKYSPQHLFRFGLGFSCRLFHSIKQTIYQTAVIRQSAVLLIGPPVESFGSEIVGWADKLNLMHVFVDSL